MAPPKNNQSGSQQTATACSGAEMFREVQRGGGTSPAGMREKRLAGE